MHHLQKEIRKALQLLDFLKISMKKRPCYRSLVYGGGQRFVNLPRPLKLLNVINLRVVRNIFHISHYFYCKYAIIVVRKEVGVFIKILTKTYKGEKRYYASLVENKRIDGKVVQRVKANLGPVTEEQIPYLKAAYARKKPHLVYDDE